MMVAIALTTASLAVLLQAMARRGTWRIGLRVESRPPVRESVIFVTPRPIVPDEVRVPASIVPSVGVRTPPSRRRGQQVSPADSGSVPTFVSTVPRASADAPRVPVIPSPSGGSRIERDGWTTPRPLAPLPGVTGVTPEREALSNERVDSILRASPLAFLEAVRRRVPTATEMDERRRAADLDQRLRGRPGLPESAMRGSFSLPSLPGARARRKREEALAAENRARLQRLAERAKQNRDSTWRADSIARNVSAVPR